LKVTISLCIGKKLAMGMYAVCVQTTSPTIYYENLAQIFLLCICYKNDTKFKLLVIPITAIFPRETRYVAHNNGCAPF